MIKSPARIMQEQIEQPPPGDPILRVTLRMDVGYEYFLDLALSVVQGIVNPDILDVFLEVPVPADVAQSVKHRYLHTSRIKEIDIHDPFVRSTESPQSEPVKADPTQEVTASETPVKVLPPSDPPSKGRGKASK